MLVILLSLIFLRLAEGLVGYDCGARALNVTTVSLLDVDECDLDISNVNVTNQYVQLLQVNEYVEVKVFQCEILMMRKVEHCGMFSHVSPVENGQRSLLYNIERKQCEQLYLTGIVELYNTVISGIRVNSTRFIPMTFAGTLSQDGECSGSTYTDSYGKWKDVIVTGEVRITIREETARINLDQNKIILNSGLQCALTAGSCRDSIRGMTFWDPIPVDNCRFKLYSILYEGYASKVTDMEIDENTVIYTITTKDVTFALAKKSINTLCGYKIIRTEHPKLIIFETVKGESFAERHNIPTTEMDMFAYMNSKFIYIEKHMKTQIKQLYRDIISQRCKVERKALMNSLAIDSQSPDQFAYNLMKGPGYMAVTAGEIIYVIKCVAVEVKLLRVDSCYAELPVERDNNTFYLTPKTHILKSSGTEVPCNSILPAVYQIGGTWFKMLPQPIETHRPSMIKPLTRATWKYESPQHLATSGIYSENDLARLRERIMFPVEKPALLNDVAREIHGRQNGNKEGVIFKLLNEEAVNKIFDSTWSRLWEKFISFGTASAGVIAIFIILHTVKSFVEILINGYMIHEMYGWSIHLLGALWNSLAHFIIYRNNRTEDQHQSEELREIMVQEEKLLPATKAITNPQTSSNETQEPKFFEIKY